MLDRIGSQVTGLVLVLVALNLLGCSAAGTRTFRVVGFAMEPNLTDGQVVRVRPVSLAGLKRGDIILCQLPNGSVYFKRLIGLPKETVEIRAGQILIQGQVWNEPYKVQPASYATGPVNLGEDDYYVLGDNRDNSYDSHSFGPIHGKDIQGIAIAE